MDISEKQPIGIDKANEEYQDTCTLKGIGFRPILDNNRDTFLLLSYHLRAYEDKPDLFAYQITRQELVDFAKSVLRAYDSSIE
ncbi:MAG: hypothetical protein OYM47_20150 [Gemmatimonadota bacterium]|nr:hypothetical protein [Gemmatimonadota bacterium]